MGSWHRGGSTLARAERKGRIVATFGAAVIAAMALCAQAEELTVFRLVARDGAFEPLKLEVPAGKRFKVEISNEGNGPMEFESRDLKQEKVLASGAKSSVVINALKPGSYVFFDDYHPDAPKGEIVAK
jgi:Cupredoxin-like domain